LNGSHHSARLRDTLRTRSNGSKGRAPGCLRVPIPRLVVCNAIDFSSMLLRRSWSGENYHLVSSKRRRVQLGPEGGVTAGAGGQDPGADTRRRSSTSTEFAAQSGHYFMGTRSAFCSFADDEIVEIRQRVLNHDHPRRIASEGWLRLFEDEGLQARMSRITCCTPGKTPRRSSISLCSVECRKPCH